jgi:GTP-binding protein LepA
VLEAIVTRLPRPQGRPRRAAQGHAGRQLLRPYLGVVVLIRVIDGVLKKGDRIRMMRPAAPTRRPPRRLPPRHAGHRELGPGEIGFLTASIKQVRDTRVGDTITHEKKPRAPLPGFKPSVPVVFCGLFPVDTNDFEDLRDAIEKLALNDASFTFEMETSAALGFGFRCGFLGLLHLEVIRDRLEREYDIDLITTAPSVIYHIYMRDGTMIELHNPADMPDPPPSTISRSRGSRPPSLSPTNISATCSLCQDRRGEQLDLTYAGTRAMVVYDLPLNEVVFDFYDRLKSVTKGYASFDYQMIGYREDTWSRCRSS